ncbi:MAG: homoaconitate hydratase [Candidatus Aenigmarchaeota archaeon]|nr:homoaconitate hydratase [Candidatus Aenigmarchaeota archaeon]MCK5334246.1 homoaconitate hydratase [Candidatus Aenigmarchaeota archaeon]
MSSNSGIQIHDTTLRDGEQTPGVVFDFNEKIILAKKAIEFGVDIIDVMPIVSDSEFRVTKELAHLFGDKVSATCRAKKEDIDLAINAGAKRATLFSPVSDLHITQKLRISREENIKRSVEMIDYALSRGLIVDFAGEDATRADLGYLKEFLQAIHNKIGIFFIADTVGCLTPESTRKLVWYVKNNASCLVGLHMHNDFGMATANTLEGIRAGADVFSGTFTGIGERAGNAPIEEVCVALKHLYKIEPEINWKFEMLKEICDTVQKFSGIALQKHKPLVGENAFSHESGIHVDGMLKNARTYEYIEPETVGHKRRIVIGKHSGKRALQHVIDKGISLDGLDASDIERAVNAIKKRKNISKEDIQSLVFALEKQYKKVLV